MEEKGTRSGYENENERFAKGMNKGKGAPQEIEAGSLEEAEKAYKDIWGIEGSTKRYKSKDFDVRLNDLQYEPPRI